MPAVPTFWPSSCAGRRIAFLPPSEMIEVSGRWTSAPMETSLAPAARASSSSGS
jgi:hypothetical protein